jgi:hypothetical protein
VPRLVVHVLAIPPGGWRAIESANPTPGEGCLPGCRAILRGGWLTFETPRSRFSSPPFPLGGRAWIHHVPSRQRLAKADCGRGSCAGRRRSAEQLCRVEGDLCRTHVESDRGSRPMAVLFHQDVVDETVDNHLWPVWVDDPVAPHTSGGGPGGLADDVSSPVAGPPYAV